VNKTGTKKVSIMK